MPLRWMLLALLLAPVCEAREGALEVDRDNLDVAGAVTLAAGTWVAADADGDGVLRIRQDGTVLDLGGATLRSQARLPAPEARTGIAIQVVGAKNVTIRNGTLSGFKIAIQARDAPGLRIDAVRIDSGFAQRLRSTPEKEDSADWLWPYENDQGEWDAKYGAGISLTACDGAHVSGCHVRDGQNGLLLTRSQRCVIVDNDFSFKSGWGIALYRSSHNDVSHNRCDWCVRGYSHGVYARGQDSAGILVFEQCSFNRFVRNSATHSGDGFFLNAGHDTIKDKGTGGCNRNLVFENDFSHAVANAIEATFSEANVFVHNRCHDSNYGVWAGYSRESLFVENDVRNCTTAGIAIEHGTRNRLIGNKIRGGKRGIDLWWDADPAFVDGVFGQHQDTRSAHNVIQANDVRGVDVGIRLAGDEASHVRWNRIQAREAALRVEGKAWGTCENNHFVGTRSRKRTPPALLAATGTDVPTLSQSNAVSHRFRAHPQLAALGRGFGWQHPRTRIPPMPLTKGTASTAWDPARKRGRDQIRMGPYGPQR